MLSQSAIKTRSPVLPHVCWIFVWLVVVGQEAPQRHKDPQRLHRENPKEIVMDPHINELTHEIIGSAIEVHLSLIHI